MSRCGRRCCTCLSASVSVVQAATTSAPPCSAVDWLTNSGQLWLHSTTRWRLSRSIPSWVVQSMAGALLICW